MLNFEFLVQIVISSLQTGAIYALVALSYIVIINATGILSFAQGEWLMAGAMIGVVALLRLNLPYAAIFLGAVIVVGLLSLGSERLLVRPLLNRGAPIISLIVMLLGVMIVVRNGTGLLLGKAPISMPLPFGGTPIRFTESIFIMPQTLFIYVTVGAIFLGIWFFFEKTRLGTAAKVVAIDPEAARLMGVNIQRVVLLSFLAGGAIAAVGGLLMAPLSSAIFTMGLIPAVKGFVAMVIGGVGSPLGALVGGLTLALVEGFAANYISTTWAEAIALVILIVMLLVRPSGIFRSIHG
jgi:branched-chain amino acid transport system permease protein